MKDKVKQATFYLSGWLALLLGFIGVFLPLLPTTPFVLVAAFCFSRSSDKLHQWLLSHPIFGSLISDWEKWGVINKKAKWLATISMIVLISYPLIWGVMALWLKITATLSVCAVLVYIWSRPSQAPLNYS